MAVVGSRGVGISTNKYTSGTSDKDVSNREDLANFISMITRSETPFLSSIGKTKASAILHEWQTDELSAPTTSILVEGADYNTSADGTAAVVGSNRTRLSNYCQIVGKTLEVSNTRRAIDQAGLADEYAYQLKKRGTELQRDKEAHLVNSGYVSDAASTTVGTGTTSARRTAGSVPSFINSPDTCVYSRNSQSGATEGLPGTVTGQTTTPGAYQGNGRYAPVLDSVADRSGLELDDIDTVMQKIYEAGGKANTMMFSPALRRKFSEKVLQQGASTGATSNIRRSVDESKSLVNSVELYMTDFGDVKVVPNYIMGLESPDTAGATQPDNWANGWALIYDPQWFKIATLRPLHEVDIKPQGDSTKGMMVEEYTLEVSNPKGAGAIFNLSATDAQTQTAQI